MIRRLTRWGKVEVNTITSQTINFQGITLEKYLNTQSKEAKNSVDPILLFPPLCQKKYSKKNHIASALAIYGVDIYLLSPENAYTLFKAENHGDSGICSLIKDLGIRTIILFDWSIPVMFNHFKFEKFENLSLNFILIRPTFEYKEIMGISRIIPFTNRWFYTFLFDIKKWKDVIPQHKASLIKKMADKNYEFLHHHKYTLINPEKSWLKTDAHLDLKNSMSKLSENLKNISSYSIKKGGWSFYRQETIVFGLILKAINNFTENNNLN